MRGLIFLLGMGGLLPMAIAAPMVGLIAYCWVSFMSPQMLVWGIAASPPWALLSVLATLLGCFVAREPKRMPRNAMVWLVILFAILTSISSFAALGPADRVFEAWMRVVKTLFFLLVLAALLVNRRRIHALVWVIVISLGFYGVVGGLFAIMTGGNFRVWGPPDSIIGDNNQLATALLIALPLMNYLRLQSAHSVIRKGLVAAMVLTLIAVLASYSRGALVGLVGVALLLWWNGHHRLLTGLVMGVVLAIGLAAMPADWTERMTTIVHYQHDASAESRLTIWREAIGIAMARPLTGGGYKSTATPEVLHQFYPNATKLAVHSVWLEVLSENGFPAFFVWLAMLLLGFVNIRRIRRLARGDPARAWAEDLARMVQVSLVAYAIAGTFLSMGYYDVYFALLVALAATRDLLAQAPAVARVGAAPKALLPALARRAQAVRPVRAGAIPAWRLRRLGR